MKSCKAFRLEKDHELSAGIFPEVYFRCEAIKELSYPWYEKAGERQITEVRIAYSAKFLYVHFWAFDSFVVAKETKPKGKVYLDDCLEFFVQTSDQAYTGYEINARGVLLDYRVSNWGEGAVEEENFDYKWKSSVQWKTKVHDAGWVLELKIPFDKDLGVVPTRGDVWRATFNRIDINRLGQMSLSTWGEPSVDRVWFHQPAGFGELHFL